MILSIATKYCRKVAFAFLAVMYLQLIIPLHLLAGEINKRSYYPVPHTVNKATGIFINEKLSRNDLATGRNDKPAKILASTPDATAKLDKLKKTPRKSFNGGPGQPEMQSFKSVNDVNWVNKFTGDFSYNIPLMDVGGYPVNLHYNAGITMDQEASWVGLGFNINPGAISRTMRGIPDDFNGEDKITREQNIRLNKTVGFSTQGGGSFGISDDAASVNLGLKNTISYNNQTGLVLERSLTAGISTGKTVGFGANINYTNNSQTGVSLTPSLDFSLSYSNKDDITVGGGLNVSTTYHSRGGMQGLQLFGEVQAGYKLKNQVSTYDNAGKVNGTQKVAIGNPGTSGGMGSFISFAIPAHLPGIRIATKTTGRFFNASINASPFIPANVGAAYFKTIQQVDPTMVRRSMPAIGYVHMKEGQYSQDVLMDYNREKESAINYKSSVNISIPQYTYDAYNISGEGINGMFRPYKNDIGYVFDDFLQSNGYTTNEKIDISIGAALKGDLFTKRNITSLNQSSLWKEENAALPYLDKLVRIQKLQNNQGEVFFRNPGEKGIASNTDYLEAVGQDKLVQLKINNNGNSENPNIGTKLVTYQNGNRDVFNEKPVTADLFKSQREKRTQVIEALTATQAQNYSLDKKLTTYNATSNVLGDCSAGISKIERTEANSYRKKHHFSEIQVLNGNGQRYIFGLPAYNVKQIDANFAVSPTNARENEKGLVSYSSVENKLSNQSGKDWHINKDITPAYVHNFLITGILSSDYVDINNDGITEDDLGDGIKFNYTQVYGDISGQYFKWRTPSYNQTSAANYNEGLKTYERDDKAYYSYGEKEVWYTYSIESKNMVAFFKTSNRTDAFSVAGEDGGYDKTKSLKKLDSIQLYTKQDLIKFGTNAKPVKTVHFRYETDPGKQLCKEINGENFGKLTLRKIWFTYNGNNKGEKNPYVFTYSSNNPNYQALAYDPWGNYKNPSLNPGGLSNAEYPYAEQVKNDESKQQVIDRANYNASAWALTEIKMPSGGKMKVTYEADEYGFVQNKRASQLMKIAGFASSSIGIPQANLYESATNDNDYVFIDVPVAVTNKAAVFELYLKDLVSPINQQLYAYFNLGVYVKKDGNASKNYESVVTYGRITDYGVDERAANGKRIWIRLENLSPQFTSVTAPANLLTAVSKRGVLANSAIQYLRLNLPSKAYPGSENLVEDVGDAFSAVFKAIKAIILNNLEFLVGYETLARKKEFCKKTDLDKSFIRLHNPYLRKIGGGHRVKKIEIFDNWNRMTQQKENVFGQTFDYTTTQVVNGKTCTIGSGVATYEPFIGGAENTLKMPVEYKEQLAPLAPVNFLYTETPFAESFYPSPSVGYSHVKVRTLNAKAKSANGWTESQFYTTKDFPTVTEFTPLDDASKMRYQDKRHSFRDVYDYVTYTQGFKIELNDMDGKPKKDAIYAENDRLHPVHSEEYFYQLKENGKLNNTVSAIDGQTGRVNDNALMGYEVEMMTDFRETYSHTVDIEDNSFIRNLFSGPVKWIRRAISPPKPHNDYNRFRSGSLMKIVNRMGIMDSMVVVHNGSVASTKNLVYDSETGDVVLTRTNNEFNDPIYNFTYPAYWAYRNMGPAYKNIGTTMLDFYIQDGRLLDKSKKASADSIYFEAGDEVWIYGYLPLSRTSSSADCDQITFDNTALKQFRAWAVKSSENADFKGLFFIDADGRAISAYVRQLKIVRSGNRNNLVGSIGGIVSMANPMRTQPSGIKQLIIDADTKVINASSSTYKNKWTIENIQYRADSCYTEYVPTYKELKANNTLIKRKGYIQNGFQQQVYDWISVADKIVSGYDQVPARGGFYAFKTRKYYTKNMLYFDNSQMELAIRVDSAKLRLSTNTPGNLWVSDEYKYGGGPFSLPSYTYNHNWGTETRWNLGNYTTNLRGTFINYDSKNIFAYDDVQGVNANKVTITNNLNPSLSILSVNVTNIAKSLFEPRTIRIINRPVVIDPPTSTPGIIMDLADESDAGLVDNTKFLSFVGNNFLGKINQGPVLQLWYKKPVQKCVSWCRSVSRDADYFNPYRFGVLGNWRIDRAYTYFNNRNESDASITTTNIRKEGVLKDFVPFWTYTTEGCTAAGTEVTGWVWNTVMNRFNQKGFEVENYDALSRYSSVLYGYQKTLPVALAQNAKASEILYTGFEDYAYNVANCGNNCMPTTDFDFLSGNADATISAEQKHSGKSSIKISKAKQAVFTFPVGGYANTADAVINYKVSTRVVASIIPKGAGLNAQYNVFKYNYIAPNNPGPIVQEMKSTIEGPIDYNERNNWTVFHQQEKSNTPDLYGNANFNFIKWNVEWTGYLQPLISDVYYFQTQGGTINPAMYITVNGIDQFIDNNISVPTGINLEAGKLYAIRIVHGSNFFPPTITQATAQSTSAKVLWRKGGEAAFSVIPKLQLYATIAAADGSLTGESKNCIKLDNIKASNLIYGGFSPEAKSKMVVSAWIKTGQEICADPAAPVGNITVSFDKGATTAVLQKTGTLIEGWQRMETVVDIPANAGKIILTATGTTQQDVYIDDIRVHPYNAHMKSYVYDPVNLRLVAELDDNNYSTFYEYDNDGTLIRVKKETVKGIQTIRETRSALYKEE
jgi:hypothetical protein